MAIGVANRLGILRQDFVSYLLDFFLQCCNLNQSDVVSCVKTVTGSYTTPEKNVSIFILILILYAYIGKNRLRKIFHRKINVFLNTSETKISSITPPRASRMVSMWPHKRLPYSDQVVLVYVDRHVHSSSLQRLRSIAKLLVGLFVDAPDVA